MADATPARGGGQPGAGSGEDLTRRKFFYYAGWGSFLTAFTIWVLGSVRFMYPRVLFEPRTVFKAGLPAEYPVGSVSEKYKKSERVWIIREADGFYALLARCTHLGCTPNWLPAENKFKCPCHGSGFHRSGINFEGPAPRPLERLKIAVGDDGQLLIDKAVVFRYEKGEWTKPGAIVKV